MTPAREVQKVEEGADVPALAGQNATDHPIIADLGDGLVLVASACPACGRVRYPPRELCPDDLTAMTAVPVSRRGTLYQAVRVDLAPQGFDPPYFPAYVDMPEGVRVFGLLDGDADDLPASGTAVEYRIDVVRRAPVETLGPRFSVVQDGTR